MNETSTIEQIQAQVKEIRDALLGNEFKKVGIVEAVREHEKRIDKLEEKWTRIYWMVLGAGAACGITVAKIFSLVTQAITK